MCLLWRKNARCVRVRYVVTMQMFRTTSLSSKEWCCSCMCWSELVALCLSSKEQHSSGASSLLDSKNWPSRGQHYGNWMVQILAFKVLCLQSLEKYHTKVYPKFPVWDGAVYGNYDVHVLMKNCRLELFAVSISRPGVLLVKMAHWVHEH